ncbi:HalOD1 output domain-containing protein [Natrinema gelatinilyticum]|uniref:HalOD1 output domain-containing protein n=1 Tax=Natrinema gelatinilyticum TaxID=2961571 RepID=UPI0020C21A89|nr:HalOD1 output domain-containing protein [Natrinema gelatinilyticum]
MTEGRVNESNGCGFGRRIQYERRADEPPSIATAMALAQYYGDDVTAASTQLYDYIDPEALDDLFAETNRGESRATGTVEFEIEDAVVTIRPDRIEVRSSG